ncbi:hypothetical protein CBS101457_002394 [Exobasidium rhododendri]|nr:hypothetical protein CBS101457_002394 [Exobasidium rhododendri]
MVSQGGDALEEYKRRRRRRRTWGMRGSVLIQTVLLLVLLLVAVNAQETPSTRPTSSKSASRSASRTSSSSSTSIADATSTAINLVESVPVRTTLDVDSPLPARFYLAAPFKNPSNPLYVSASLCAGPSIEPYNATTTDSLKSENVTLDSYDASLSTLIHMYVSTSTSNQVPGPNSQGGKPDVQYLLGGFAQDMNTDTDPDGAWITLWPPTDARNVTGTWTLTLSASTEGSPAALRNNAGLSFSDSDSTNALFTSFNYTFPISPNLTLYVLPTTGPDALPNADYFNSSVCAIVEAFQDFNMTTNNNRFQINSSETNRGSTALEGADQLRRQWQVANLGKATNYTAWMVEYGEIGSPAVQNLSIWPAVKFVTKKNSNCRLVYDVDFCPQVAYSIPVSSTVSTETALSIINNTVSPNYANFSATVDTFSCNSSTFGLYSPVQTCVDCKRQYQDWLCAVTMPRCVDSIPQMDNDTTAAIDDPLTLNGASMDTNPSLLPYVINRDNNSRQSYIDDPNGLDAGAYGELLPCIYTCYFVSRTCPAPLIQWTCPTWDVTAQSDYGTFADLGTHSGAGADGQRWGGPTRYISQDAFGNLYCNSLGVDRYLREINGAVSYRNPSFSLFVAFLLIAFTTAWTSLY